MTGGVQPFCAPTPSDEDEVVMKETIIFLMNDAGEVRKISEQERGLRMFSKF